MNDSAGDMSTTIYYVVLSAVNQPKITEAKEFEIDPRTGPETREAQQKKEKKA